MSMSETEAIQVAADAAGVREILLFDIEDSTYGVAIQYITEIIQMQPITIVPRIPDFIKGVINLRGKVIPVMSVRSKFGKMEIPYDDKTCIIVVEWEGCTVGLIVDQVQEVLTVGKNQISAPPDYRSVNANRYISNIVEVGKDIYLLLDCQKLVTE